MIATLAYLALGLLLLPALAPLLAFLKDGRAGRKAFLTAIGIAALLLTALAAYVLYTGTQLLLPLYDLAPGLGLTLLVDRLSAFFILIIAVVAFAVAIYSAGYVEHLKSPVRKNLLIALMSIFVLSMVLVISAKGMVGFLFSWELMSLASFLLVNFEYEKKGTRKAGLYYLAMTQLSTVFLIAATGVIYAQTGSFDLQRVAFSSPFWASLAFLFAFLGFGIKAGIVPFHKWLPYAHPAAPSNISALMSGLMIKVAIYGLVRFLLTVLPPGPVWWGILLLTAGTVSAILGVIYALKEHDLKRLLAYHSIENIGIIVMGLGLFEIFSAAGLHAVALLALGGALFHTLNHALFKSLLFLTSGSVLNATKTMNIERMGGLSARMPGTAALFLIGAVSISALPPFNGFVSELMLFEAFFQAYLLASPYLQMLLVIAFSVFALTSALAAACFVKAYGVVFLGVPRSKEAKEAKEAPRSMLAGPAVLAALCIVLGLFSFQLFAIAGFSFPVPDLLVVGLLLLAVYALTAFALRNVGKRRTCETWSCGYPSAGSVAEYTASGFSEPIIRIFDAIFLPKLTVEREYHDGQKALFKRGTAEMRLMRFFEEYLYDPVARAVEKAAAFVARLQDVDLDLYVAYIFVSALLLIIVARFLI